MIDWRYVKVSVCNLYRRMHYNPRGTCLSNCLKIACVFAYGKINAKASPEMICFYETRGLIRNVVVPC
jgi:hypothetical protein